MRSFDTPVPACASVVVDVTAADAVAEGEHDVVERAARLAPFHCDSTWSTNGLGGVPESVQKTRS